MIFSIIFLKIIGLGWGLNLQSCPGGLSWHIRSEIVCVNNSVQYHCLLDNTMRADEEIYVEKCYDAKTYNAGGRTYKKGKRIVFAGNRDAIDCQPSFYSPKPLWSNHSENCPFRKSICNEEGQLISDNGSTDTDRYCRCDNINGYNYTIKPANLCRCSSSMEDCSCYLAQSSKNGQVIYWGYKCQNISGSNTLTGPGKDNTRTEETVLANCPKCEYRSTFIYKIQSKLGVVLLTVFVIVFVIIPGIIVVLVKELQQDAEHGTSNGNHSKDIITNGRSDQQVKKPNEIYQQSTDIHVVHYFQPVQQLNQIQLTFRNTDKRLIILEGQHGSGKTQAAHEFFYLESKHYAVAAKLSAIDEYMLFESLKSLAQNLKMNTEIKEVLTPDRLISIIAQFLNYNKDVLCLLFIDDVDSKHPTHIRVVSELLKKVKRLKVIIATVDATVKSIFADGHVIEFRGMTITECHSLLQKGLIIYRRDVEAIVECIGSFPLFINSARQYLITTKKSPWKYVSEIKKMDPIEMYNTLDHKDTFYDKGIFNAQRLPLQHIKHNIEMVDSSLWEFLTFLPFFQFHSISTTVLEACYFHFKDCVCTDKVRKIDFLVDQFLKYSICHINTAARPAMFSKHLSRSNSKPKEDIFLSFHDVTINILQWIISQNKNEPDSNEKQMKCLLKWFSFEIDMDARADTTLERNMLFIGHAIKLLDMFQSDTVTEPYVKIYLAYLNCAVGSSLYFQKTDLEKSHAYLMKSRKMCLSIVQDESFFTKSVCPFITTSFEKVKKPATPEQIKEVSKLLFDHPGEETFVLEFNLHKRRSKNDLCVFDEMEQNSKRYKTHYLSRSEYETLIKKELAIPVEDQCKIFLAELAQRILYNNGRTLKELYYIKQKDTHVREAYYAEFKTVYDFCSLMKEKYPRYRIFSCIENDRSGRMLLRYSKTNVDASEINDDVTFYTEMLMEPFKICYEFGVIKMSPKACDRHISLQILLKNLQQKYMEETNEKVKADIYKIGMQYICELEKVLECLERNKSFVWLNLPKCYIQCAQFLQLYLDKHDLEKAVKLFRKAADLEESRGVLWTRYLWCSYYGEVFCLRKLAQEDEERKIIEKVKGKLEGTNRQHLIQTLVEMKNKFPY